MVEIMNKSAKYSAKMGVDSSAENTWSAQFAQKIRILLEKGWASVVRACSQIF